MRLARRMVAFAALFAVMPSCRLAAQVSPAHQARIAWVPNPRVANSTWVSDASRHLKPETVDSLNAVIGTLERETGDEIAVVVVDSLAGLSEQEFALAIHRGWGVGKRDRDNGLVLLWAPNDRAVFISVGNGLEGVIPDRRAGRIRDQQIFAAFRDDRFDDGVLAGVRALAAAAREEIDPVRRAARIGAAEDDGDGGVGPLGIVGGLLGAGVAGVGGTMGYLRWRRRRPRNCTQGHPMRLLDDREEIAQLDKDALLEQQLKSIDWDVWLCDSCGETQRFPYKRGAWEDCPQCKRRTVKPIRKVIDQPSTLSTGLARITKVCKNCGHKTISDEIIPRVQVTSGGSSGSSSGGGGGGGGSFGGGSAGGGGAGGRY